MSELNYPNLAPCRVIVRGSGGASKPPVRLPQDCLAAAREGELPAPYDFQIEKSVLELKEERIKEINSTGSEEEIKHTVLAKMKSLTNADEEVCVELLESNKYDLNTSVEAYFAR